MFSSYFMSFETSGMLFILSFILFAFLFLSVNTAFSLYSGNSLSQPYLGQLLGALVSGLAGRTWTGKVWAFINTLSDSFFSFLVHNHNSFSLLTSREIIVSFSGVLIICSFLCLYKMQVCWVLHYVSTSVNLSCHPGGAHPYPKKLKPLIVA